MYLALRLTFAGDRLLGEPAELRTPRSHRV